MECSDGEGVEMQLTPDNVEPDQCNVDSSDNNEPPRKRSKLDNDISDRVKRSYIEIYFNDESDAMLIIMYWGHVI